MQPSHEHTSDRPSTVTNGHRPPGDGYADSPGLSATVHRVTVPEAAEILGTTTDAVRSRLRRGKLRREEGEDGTVYVVLERGKAANGTDGQETVEDRRETVADSQETVHDSRETVEDSPLVEILRDQVDHLRSELALERESSSELRRIIAAMTQRVPVVELESPPDERNTPETASEESVKGNDRGGDQEPRRASWWRRFFGFE